MEATINKRTLIIDGMTGEACVQKVRTALRGVKGVTAESVKVGRSTISCSEPEQCDAACAAIAAVGFRATDARATSQTNGSAHAKTPATSETIRHDSAASIAMTSEGACGSIGDSAASKPSDHAAVSPTTGNTEHDKPVVAVAAGKN